MGLDLLLHRPSKNIVKHVSGKSRLVAQYSLVARVASRVESSYYVLYQSFWLLR